MDSPVEEKVWLSIYYKQDLHPRTWHWYQIRSYDDESPFTAIIGCRKRDNLILLVWPSTIAPLRKFMRKPAAVLFAYAASAGWDTDSIPYPTKFSCRRADGTEILQ